MNPLYHIYFYIVIFGFLVFGFYMLLRSISIMDSAKRNMQKLYTELHDRNTYRVTQIEKERRKYGTITKKADDKHSRMALFMMKLDNLLIYSEVGIKYRWLNTSTYIVLMTVGGCLVFLLCMVFMKGVLIPLLLTTVTVLVPYAYMVNVANNNYSRTEEQLEFFINMVANNSMTTNDLITIMEKTAPYMAQPIRGALERAVVTSRINSDPSECIRQLTRDIEHPIFVRFIRNLEVCSRNDANYHNITKDFSSQLEISLRSAERQRAIYDNARKEILLLLIINICILPMTCALVDATFFQMLSDMTKDILGVFVLVVLGLLYGSTAVYLLIGKRR